MEGIRLYGNWKEGYAIDLHTYDSTYIGEDEYGKPEFNNEYSVMGRLLYNFKYKGDTIALQGIMEIVKPFLDNWGIRNRVGGVVAVPSSKLNRLYQPVFEIVKSIAEYLHIPYATDKLWKTSRDQIKGINQGDRNLKGQIELRTKLDIATDILLVDDLYSSGVTLNECCNILKTDSNVGDIYVLTMTKTRCNR